MNGKQREILQSTPTYIIARVYDPVIHEQHPRRGGYLLLISGKIPEIVLDGLAGADEQHIAQLRCMRELESMLYIAQTMNNSDQERRSNGREIVSVSAELVVTRTADPAGHRQRQQRGAYLNLVPGKIPEIVLDGSDSEKAQREGEQRCLRELETHKGVERLQGLLAPRSKGSAPPQSKGSTPAQSKGSTPPRSQGTVPPRSQGSVPPRSQGTVPPRSQGTVPPQPRGSAPPRSQRTAPPQSSAASPGLLGQRLLAQGLITEEALEQALEQQRQLPADRPVRRLGSLLIEAGELDSTQLTGALSDQNGTQAGATTVFRVDPPLRGLFALDQLERLQAAPLFRLGQTVVVAMADPHRRDLLEALQALTRYPVRAVQASQHQIQRLLASLKPREQSRR